MSGARQSSVCPMPRQCPPSPWEPHPPTMPHLSIPDWGAEGLNGTRAFLPHHPLTMITVEGSCAGEGTVSAPSPFHPGTFPAFVTQFGFVTQALAPSHVPGSEVMDSKAGESSLVGRGVGGLLAWCHSVGRA